MKIYKVFNIKFDIGNDKRLERELRKHYSEIYFSAKNKKSKVPVEKLADKISDVTGFGVNGFNYELITIYD